MTSKRPQTAAKRAREQAVKERRDRKRAKKAEAAGRGAGALNADVALELSPEPSQEARAGVRDAGE
jgi:hypothetical protein